MIVQINRHRIFSLVEAQNLLPVVYRLTEETSREVRKILQCLETLPDKQSSRAAELEGRADGLIDRWQKKIERLGGSPKGMWLVDFDNGQGYWCWKFPEVRIEYSHGYQDGFSGRRLVENTHGKQL
ncbi:MAG: DUF2203 domain-containing protein [Bdellovibrionaceae bacterium]|nr:DUF2203 domain-containing protein [Pseudobdellovibrionaceae bacterium]